MKLRPWTVSAAVSLIALGSLTSCMSAYKKSVGATAEQVATKTYRTDLNEAWQATLDALKSVRLDVSNRDAGFLQTRWVDNTSQKNLAEGDGGVLPYMKAKYRFKVNVAQIVVGGQNAVKVNVQKEQLILRDALEDFKHQESDLIEEKTLLYRIGRIITVKSRLARAEKRRLEAEMKAFDPGSLGEASEIPAETPVPEIPEVAPEEP